MILFPNAKINLGLNIIRKRPDGYHDLETFFCPVSLCDILEIIPQNQLTHSIEPVLFSNSGIIINGSSADNICVKAWHLLKKDFPDLSPVRIHLHKVIPTGAGLGGGSSNGAFTLLLLNTLFNLQINQGQLIQYALQLGSDCPFFILNKPSFAQGQGERLEPVAMDLSGYELLLVHPGIHISTAKAFAGIRPKVPNKSLKSLLKKPVTSWRKDLVNDFEASIFPLFPAIKEIKEQLYAAGAVYASMSGSGSAVYGLFEKGKMPTPIFPAGHHVFRLLPDLP